MITLAVRRLFSTSIALCLISALLLGSTVVAALDFPALTGRVVDRANLLSPDLESRIETQLEQHERATSNQVVVVTLPSLQGTTIEDYGYQLGRHWAIGQAERNNGVLLIVAPNQRKVRIEVGYGLEGALPDAISKAIIEQEILPAFRDNDFPKGIATGVDAILAAIAGTYEPQPEAAQKKGNRIGLVIAFLFVVVTVLKFFLGDKFPVDIYVGGYRIGGGSGRGSSGGSGGGFSGGGGSFGGGGSSGGW